MHVSEAELRGLCSPLGTVVRTLVLQNKFQAFVEMENIEQASVVVTFYTGNLSAIRDKRVYIQFSTRSEISIPSPPQSPSNNTADVKQLSNSRVPQSVPMTSSTPTPSPNSILLVSVTNMRKIELTLENLHQAFKMCGNVLKIITFFKSGTFKALVQMGSLEEATHAMNSLDSREIFSNCCTLRIGYSNLPELRIKANGPTSWDFTVLHSQPLQYQPSYISNQQPGYLISPQQALPPYSYDSKMMHMDPMNGGMIYPDPALSGACVLLVNNLSTTETTPDSLFALFGVYGDVIRVKILFSKRDTALIQFSAPHQAHQAYLHLNHLYLHNEELSISFSKHRNVAMPRQDVDSETLTKDYTDSPFHRFRSVNGRGSRRVYIHPPSRVLHVSNIYDEATDEELQKLFGVESTVQFFVESRRMAYVCLPSIHSAVLTLMATHNQKLGNRHVRVSFSAKNPASILNEESKQQEN
jgi:RNA recognition motif-containing protein